jgi:flagellar motor switch protein FliN
VENNLTQTNGATPSLNIDGMSAAGGNSLLGDLAAEAGTGAAKGDNFAMLMDVGLQLTVELGRTHLTVRQVLDLQKGSVLELDRIAGDAVDIFVNDRLVARGDVVVVDDKFGVRIVELMSPNKDA